MDQPNHLARHWPRSSFNTNVLPAAPSSKFCCHASAMLLSVQSVSCCPLPWWIVTARFALYGRPVTASRRVSSLPRQKIVQLNDPSDSSAPELALPSAQQILRPHGCQQSAFPFLPYRGELINFSPVTGLTLRHGRIDNFWFVLRHEQWTQCVAIVLGVDEQGAPAADARLSDFYRLPEAALL